MHLTQKQKEILVGTLLGDACLEKNGHNVRLRIEHSLHQKDYLQWKYTAFSSIVSRKPRLVSSKGGRAEKAYERLHLSTFSLPELCVYQHKFYNRKRKIIPHDILELLKSPLSLAVWHMDDGYKRNDCNAFRISTDSFKWNGQKLLQNCLKKNFNLKVTIHRKGKFWNIYIPNPVAKDFCKIVRPYIIPSMMYKISLTP